MSYFLKTEGSKFKPMNWSNDGVPPGAVLDEELQKQIEQSEIFIAFICQDYVNRIAARELRWAIDHWTRRAGQMRIIPLALTRSGLDYWNSITESEPSLGQVTFQCFFDGNCPGMWQQENA
jgi:hypothetical protein